MSKVTDAMYEAGLNYLKGRGTAWCVSDLYKAMSAAKVADEIGTLINHEHEPHCCGCWVLRYDDAGLNAVCNECGETRDLIALLAQPEDGDTVPRSRYDVACQQYTELRLEFDAKLRAIVEECAKECEAQKKRWLRGEQPHTISDHDACAAAIRAQLPQRDQS